MANIEVLSRTQRIIVTGGQSITVIGGDPIVRNSVVNVVNAGPPGPPGIDGAPGLPGANAGRRWYGEGPPGTVIGAAPNDEYVDTLTGDLYVLQ